MAGRRLPTTVAEVRNARVGAAVMGEDTEMEGYQEGSGSLLTERSGGSRSEAVSAARP